MASVSSSSAPFWKAVTAIVAIAAFVGLFLELLNREIIPKKIVIGKYVVMEFERKEPLPPPPPVISTTGWSFPKDAEIYYFTSDRKELSILDGTLYVSAESVGIKIGGANLAGVEVAAQTKVGRNVKSTHMALMTNSLSTLTTPLRSSCGTREKLCYQCRQDSLRRV